MECVYITAEIKTNFMRKGLLKEPFEKRAIRLLTPKKWRRKLRRRFFESIFQELEKQHDCFSGINKKPFGSFENTCEYLANRYPFYPTDKVFEMNVGKAFKMYAPQAFEILEVKVRRTSSVIRMFLMLGGKYSISVFAEENGETVSFDYDVKYPTKTRNI